MVTVIKRDKIIDLLLDKQKLSADTKKFRLLSFAKLETVGEDYVLYNNLTKEMVRLDKEEFICLERLEKSGELDKTLIPLYEGFFIVPFDNDDVKLSLQVAAFSKNLRASRHRNLFTILTTSDCNARCYYCFENGQRRIHMSEKTARDVAAYIINNCDKSLPVTLNWFGGEPLYNKGVIDVIISELEKANVSYKSTMISNGYLFDDETVKQAKEKWNLKRVQITLDGTEDVYNKAKNYIYEGVNPFKVVIENIKKLIDAEIKVQVRLNYDEDNADNLLELIDYLYDNVGNSKYIYVYPHQIFDTSPSSDFAVNKKRQLSMFEIGLKITRRIDEKGFKPKSYLDKTVKYCSCMADSGKPNLIHPDGNLGCCEHFTDSEVYGNIYEGVKSKELLDAWSEKHDVLTICHDCPLFPTCFKLKKCPSALSCSDYQKDYEIKNFSLSIANTYEYVKTKKETDA